MISVIRLSNLTNKSLYDKRTMKEGWKRTGKFEREEEEEDEDEEEEIEEEIEEEVLKGVLTTDAQVVYRVWEMRIERRE